MGLHRDALTPDAQAALALVRAGAEMGRHARGVEHSQRAFRDWVRLVDPTASANRCGQLSSSAWDLTLYPDWLSAYRTDAAVELLPPQVVVLGLLVMQPPAAPVGAPTWQYLDAAARQLGISGELIATLLGWMRATASDEVEHEVSAMLGELADKSDAARAIVHAARTLAAEHREKSGRAGFEHAFAAARRTFIEQIEHVLARAEALGVESTGFKRLKEQIESDYFRVAVLGEFKRGKSTLINAMLGSRDLLPADILPSTSALIEIRYGDTLEFLIQDSLAPGHYSARSKEAFHTDAGAAALHASRREEARAEGERIPRWRLHVPSEFLRKGIVEIVDTPGLGEDYARDWIAKQEAHRADAAILVFAAKQLGSQMELDLVAEMAPKLENLVLAVNWSDDVAPTEWPRLRGHVVTRLKAKGLTIPEERIIFVAASREGVDQNGVDWTAQLVELSGVVQDHLIARCGSRKATALAKAVLAELVRARAGVDGTLRVRRRGLEHVEGLEQAARDAQRMFETARQSVDIAATEISASRSTAERLTREFFASLDQIFDAVSEEKKDWLSSHSIVTSPKKHVKEVAEKAGQSVGRAVAAWVMTKGAAIVQEDVEARFRDLSKNLSSLTEFIEIASGRDAPPVIEDLKRRALEDAGGGPVIETKAEVGGAVLQTALRGAITLAVGYVVSDIVLYYILGVISGFLNPILLAAALVVSVVGWLLKGEDWARIKIRQSVFDKLKDGLAGPDSKARLAKSFGKASEEAFGRIGNSFKANASELLNELRYQQQQTERELNEKRIALGTPEVLAAQLAALEKLASEARRALDSLELAATEIAVAANSS